MMGKMSLFRVQIVKNSKKIANFALSDKSV